MSFPKYPEVKDSGVEWLGEVPAHWDVVPLRGASKQEAYSFTDGDWVESPFITDEGVRLIQTGNIGVGKYREQGFRYISEDTFKKLNCTEFSPGDVLICRLADPVGRACLAPDLGGRMITSVDVCILKTRDEIDSNFLVYYLSSEPYLSFMSSVSRGGTRERVSRSFLGGVRVSMPSLEEQRTIASFLDHETARIDALVEQQQRLIELLKEKRQAVISHAVTKGLDPDVPMQDSGVDWLGEVPAHWEVRKLSSITEKITNGYVGPTRGLFVDDGIPYLQSLHIKNNVIKFTPEYYVTKEWSDAHEKSILSSGDVLVVQTGDIGQVAVVPEGFPEANCHALIIVSAIKKLMAGDWLAWVLDSDYGYNSLLSIKTGALHPHLNCGYVKDIYIPVPPLKEQSVIVKHVAEQQGVFLNLISEAESMIGYLKERRSALISASVTGKIDVRGWQPPASSSAPTNTTQTETV